jgi:membrane dipeptidase
MPDAPATEPFPGLTDVHAHPAMNAFLWDRDLRRHYFTGRYFNPLASLTDFKMLQKGGVKVLWSSLHVPESQYFERRLIRALARTTRGGRKLLKLNAWECLLAQMGAMEEQVSRADRFEMATSNDELDAVLHAGKTAIVHTVEGGHVLGAGLAAGDVDGRLARVEQLADRGVASLTLAHLFPNELAGHAEAIPAAQRRLLRLDTGVDLSRGLERPPGLEVVKHMADLRIVPDVAHCTPVARREVYDAVGDRIPVIASHVGVQSMNPEPYNLDQSDVEAIRASRGLVGVIFMPHWLDRPDPKDGLEAIWETMETIHRWSGGSWDQVAIGTDFDGFTDPPDDCTSAAELPVVRELLDRKGLSRAEADAVLGGNARRVLRRGWRERG